MSKFRKKPVVIEAFQFDGDFMNSEGEFYIPIWAVEAFESGTLYFHQTDSDPCELQIKTLEGIMTANVNDYVIKGVQGEIYSCKPDIFNMTYESVRD